MPISKNKILDQLYQIAENISPDVLDNMADSHDASIAVAHRLTLRELKLSDEDMDILFYVDTMFEIAFTPDIIEKWDSVSIEPVPDEWR